MGADYYLDVQCAVRKELGNEGIILLIKQVNVLEKILQENPDVADDVVINGVRQVGQERTEYTMTIAEFKEIRKRYENLSSAHCNQCKYNLLADGMGCMGRINYPIPTKTELLIFSTTIDNLQTVGEMNNPFIKSLVEIYPSELSTKAIVMYRQRGMMFENRLPIQTSQKISKNLISSDFIWASYIFPHDSDLPFGKESEDDKILIEYSHATLERLYDHAKLLDRELKDKMNESEIANDTDALAALQNMRKYYNFIQFAHEDKIPLFMFP